MAPVGRARALVSSAINDLRKVKNRINRPAALDRITVFKKSDKEIEIYNLLSDGNILMIKFSQKPWGTWNIEGRYTALDGGIPAKALEHMAGCETDSEYVFRVSEKADLHYEFSGGNHGKEKLKGLKLINDEDNSELDLTPGKEVRLKVLRIIENTSLCFDDSLSREYADVKREYRVSPSKIELKTDFTFTSDVFMGTSYVCMLPVTKEYGRYVKFDDTGNIYTTPKPGETLTTNNFKNFLGKEGTMSAEAWGDIKPSYKFRVWIGNKEMVDGFKNRLKVFYWDLNKFVNKLYFSRFDNEEPVHITPGTVWHNTQGWELNIK